MHAMSDLSVTLHALYVHPIKSCAGVPVAEALVIETGLEFDRAWMVVDESGGFVTQRELPRMQLVRPAFRGGDLVLRAPGMLALHLRLDAAEGPVRVQVWDDTVRAYDMGDLAARWFSDFLGRPLRVARFDPDQRRLSNPRWTGGREAENAFADAFPLLVTSTASLDELNRRLGERGKAAVTMERFRPNLVLDGLDAHGEDHLDELAFDTPGGPVRLKLVKPCVRCTIPNVDPATAEPGHEPGETLAGYRADPRLDGALTFGMNAIVLEGIDRTLRPGLRGEASVRF
jgi:uncharacterized protein YcbX